MGNAAMTELNNSIAGIPMPDRIRRLPVSPKGFPVPWFVQWYDDDKNPTPFGTGIPDFRVVEARKHGLATRLSLCWICGDKLGTHKAFTIGPMCAINRVISEPPQHRDCSVYSAVACPFLSNPRMRRNERELPDERQDAAGMGLKRNPGAVCVWIGSVGIDLGLKDLATCSDGTKVPALQHYRQYEKALEVAQRAHNKPRVKAIHAKIANSRRHHLHEQSTRIVRENELIVVGNVNAAALAKTKMAKSVLDAGWSSFRNMLEYKASRHRARYMEVDERWTTQVCSSCGCIPDSSPKGMGALGMRHWSCSDCGESHDRDLNAARNILRVGLERQTLAGEIPAV